MCELTRCVWFYTIRAICHTFVNYQHNSRCFGCNLFAKLICVRKIVKMLAMLVHQTVELVFEGNQLFAFLAGNPFKFYWWRIAGRLVGPRSPFQYKRSNPHLAVVKGLRSYNGSEELRNYLALTKNRKYFVCKAGRPRCEAGRAGCRSCNKKCPKCPARSSLLWACRLGGVDCNTHSLGGVLGADCDTHHNHHFHFCLEW